MEVLFPNRKSEWEELVYIEWVYVCFSAIKGLGFYSIESNEWKQPHRAGVYAIMKVLMEAGNDFIKLEEGKTAEGIPTVILKMDKKQIWTTGKKAMGEFCKHLQVYKSTADVEMGTKYFKKYLEVDEKMLRFREIITATKTPRRMELFYDLKRNENGKIEMVKFEKGFEGLIKSHLYHYQDSYEDVYHVWNDRKDYFRIKSAN